MYAPSSVLNDVFSEGKKYWALPEVGNPTWGRAFVAIFAAFEDEEGQMARTWE